MLANLDNEVYFRHVFSDLFIFNSFVKDILDIDTHFSTVESKRKFMPKVGYVDFEIDLFAESDDHRVIVEIQRIEYDYNFDRFLHYFMMSIAELQRSCEDYKIEKSVYGIIVITAPYKITDKGNPIRDEVLITNLNPRNLKGQELDLFGHKLLFLNPNYRNNETPQSIKDWLDLIYESIHNPENPKINQNNKAIEQAVKRADKDKLSPTVVVEAKIAASKRITLKLAEDEIEKQKQELQTKDKEIQTKNNELQTKDNELQTKNKELQEEKAKLILTVKNLKAKGMDNKTISEITGMDISEIENL